MKVFCGKCRNELSPLWQYCCYCGAKAPLQTATVNSIPPEIKDGVFCISCSNKNPKDAIYCTACGSELHKKPQAQLFFCPACGKENETKNKFCFACSIDFSEWFAMEGLIATELGYEGNLILQETMTNIEYHFLYQNKVSLGRKDDDDIIISDRHVSSLHCVFNLKKWILEDRNSTNGVFVNKSPKRIASIDLSSIEELNIASIFTFTVYMNKNLFCLRLTAVLQNADLDEVQSSYEINKLRNHIFVLIGGNDEFGIRKTDGEIVSSSGGIDEYYLIRIKDGHYYYSDISNGISNRLVLKANNNFPINWKIKFVK